MTFLQACLIFSVNLVRVSGKAFQQLSVVHNRYRLIAPVSFLLAFTETLIWGGAGLVAVSGSYTDMILYAFILGLSGTIGTIFSMVIHKRIRQKSFCDSQNSKPFIMENPN